MAERSQKAVSGCMVERSLPERQVYIQESLCLSGQVLPMVDALGVDWMASDWCSRELVRCNQAGNEGMLLGIQFRALCEGWC